MLCNVEISHDFIVPYAWIKSYQSRHSSIPGWLSGRGGHLPGIDPTHQGQEASAESEGQEEEAEDEPDDHQ